MIEFRGIDLSYNGRKLFRDFDLSLGRSEKVAVLGKSGTGKSTLFNLLLGFVRPDGGEVRFGGDTVDDKTVWDIRRSIAYVDQDVSIGEGRGSDLIRSALELKVNASRKLPGEKMDGLLDYFELSPAKLEDDITDLSGGERQRLAIILAVLLGREIFLLDEVTSALDKDLKKKTAQFFAGKDSWTVMVISHDPVWVDNPGVSVFDLEREEWIQ
ncbi:MAG: ATP-binding cassette domain-containing protein [Candidatus Latescibacteria bacterium]|nr:ATP-binding cassette domain-containing protein [bacterium]MBD3424245.1 ATP-binding cassette domain-containing protein [Candidatus Latescibacterota bacterium]